METVVGCLILKVRNCCTITIKEYKNRAWCQAYRANKRRDFLITIRFSFSKKTPHFEGIIWNPVFAEKIKWLMQAPPTDENCEEEKKKR